MIDVQKLALNWARAARERIEDALPHVGQIVVAVLLLTLPFASALVAIRAAPPTHVDIAGQAISVKPVVGQDTTRVQGGALVRPEHAHVDVLDKDVGVDVSANWNQLIPKDKKTRKYLVALWDDPQPEIDRIRAAARFYLIQWGVIGFFMGAVCTAGVALGLRTRRRRLARYRPDLAEAIRAHNRRMRIALASTGTLGILLVDGVGANTYLHRDHHVVASSPEFADTTLEDTEVNGLMADVLPFLSVLRPRNQFYDHVATNLEAALSGHSDLISRKGRTVFVVAEDFEDVNGMARQVGLTARLLDADFIALSGDITFAGKPIETYLIDTVNYYSENRPVYFAPGLHDTRAIVEAAQARGWHVADALTTTIGDLSLLAAPDPRVSLVGDFGVGDVLRDPDVDLDTFIENTTSEACRTHPDFVLLHDHGLGAKIAAAGCQRVAVLDGRSYQFLGPRPVRSGSDTTYELTSGSAGGHVSTKPDPGAIRHPARFVVMTHAPRHGATTYSVVTVRPDASVTVTQRIDLAVPFATYLHDGRTTP